jgi:hypothetical protein
MTFGTTEPKYFTVVSYKHYPMCRVNRRRTEVTLVNTHVKFGRKVVVRVVLCRVVGGGCERQVSGVVEVCISRSL